MSETSRQEQEIGFVPGEKEKRFISALAEASQLEKSAVIQGAVGLMMRIAQGNHGKILWTQEPMCEDEVGYHVPFDMDLNDDLLRDPR